MNDIVVTFIYVTITEIPKGYDGTAPLWLTPHDLLEAGNTAPQETQQLHRLEKFTFQLWNFQYDPDLDFTSDVSLSNESYPVRFYVKLYGF